MIGAKIDAAVDLVFSPGREAPLRSSFLGSNQFQRLSVRPV